MTGQWNDMPASERAALQFARKLTIAAYKVTDDEVADLIKHFGAEKVVAIVHTLAHANFQDRIILALGVEVEADGPYPPLELQLDKERQARIPVPNRSDWNRIGEVQSVSLGEKPNWRTEDFGQVQKALSAQKQRTSRIPLPPLESLDKLPPAAKKRSGRIAWSRVSLGYQPLLTQAWFECMSMFDEESKLDQVFANTYFWVITRSNECYY